VPRWENVCPHQGLASLAQTHQQKRYALESAIAASAVPAIVMSKNHLVQDIPEMPLVVADTMQEYTKTKQAAIFMYRIKA